MLSSASSARPSASAYDTTVTGGDTALTTTIHGEPTTADHCLPGNPGEERALPDGPRKQTRFSFATGQPGLHGPSDVPNATVVAAPSARRAVFATAVIGFLGLVFLMLSLVLGLQLVGHNYHYGPPYRNPRNWKAYEGWITNDSKFMGLMMIVFHGPTAIFFLWAFYTRFMVVCPSRALKVFVICLSLVASFITIALLFVYCMQPTNLFIVADPWIVSEIDPLWMTTGNFFLVAFLFLDLLLFGALVKTIPSLNAIYPKALWYEHFSTPRRRVLGVSAMFVVLGLSVSSLICSPLGGGELFPGRYFRATSKYSLVNWQWSDNFIYKLFPDVLGYYVFVVGVVLLSALPTHAKMHVLSCTVASGPHPRR
eukprot:m.237487 g.237487  ORF g.237487 m.237487 type:complete len:368 (+) comp21154_c0_seq1:1389-2492(+)